MLLYKSLENNHRTNSFNINYQNPFTIQVTYKSQIKSSPLYLNSCIGMFFVYVVVVLGRVIFTFHTYFIPFIVSCKSYKSNVQLLVRTPITKKGSHNHFRYSLSRFVG